MSAWIDELTISFENVEIVFLIHEYDYRNSFRINTSIDYGNYKLSEKEL